MNAIQQTLKLNRLELEKGLTDTASWHNQYAHSAHIYVGGLPKECSEGDVIAICSQQVFVFIDFRYGEVVDINLVRDKTTGKSLGYAFLAFEDQRSTILAVDNLTGFSLLGRMLRVDHVAHYRGPKKDEQWDPEQEKERRNAILPKHLQTESGREETAGEERQEKVKEDDLDLEDPMREYILSERRSNHSKHKRKKHKRSRE